MDERLTCAITGHRYNSLPFGSDETRTECKKLKDTLQREFVHLIESEGVTRFLCGMALGVDQIAAEILIRLKSMYPFLTLIAYIPCREQYRKWNQAQLSRYRAILKQTDEIRCFSETYTPDCMHRRNRALVEDAGHLVAVLIPGKRGGTASTVAYARKLERNIHLIDPTA